MLILNGHNKTFTVEVTTKTFSGKSCEPRIEICFGDTCRITSMDNFYDILFQDWQDWLNDDGTYANEDEE